MKIRCDMRCDKLCDRGSTCRKLSQRLIAKVEPGSTFATTIVRRVRQRPIFMTPSFVSLGTRGNFTRESGEGRKLRMVTGPSETFPFHFVLGRWAFPSADTLQWIRRTYFCASFSPSETYDSGEELNDDSQVDLFVPSSSVEEQNSHANC